METEVLLNQLPDSKVIVIIGKATMNTSKTISEMIDILLEEKEKVSLDMTKCKYIDSTFLGLIAESTMNSQNINNTPIKIINPNGVVEISLKQTGIDKFVEIVLDEDIASKYENSKELELKKFENKLEHAEYVLKMHKILSNLNDNNQEMFKNVLNQMEAILKLHKK